MINHEYIQLLKRQPRLGMGLIDELKNLGGLAETAFKNLTNTFNAFNKGNIATIVGLEKQYAINEKLADIVKKRAEGALLLEKRNLSLNKSLGVTVKQAAEISQNIANFSKDMKISQLSIIKMQGNFKKLATTVDLTSKGSKNFQRNLTASQTLLTRNLKLSDEQAEKFQYYASMTQKVNGQEKGFMTDRLQVTINTAKKIEDATGMSGALKTITEEIAAASATTQLQFGRLPGNLELAAIKAKRLGLSIEEMASSGKQMLDIESSIGNELEYQLLSGRRLTDDHGQSLTNLYREATLRGDMNAQADIMNRILETEGETLENNMLAREQMSKLLGIDEAKISRALQKQKILLAAGDAGAKLMGLQGDKLINAATQLQRSGQLSPQDLQKIITAEQDTRSTEEIMAEELDIQNDTLAATILMTQQTDRIFQVQKEMLELQRGSFIERGMMPSELKDIGKAIIKTNSALSTFSDIDEIAKSRKDYTRMTGAKQEDFILRSSGELLSFTQKDDVLGLKQGGAIDNLITAATTNGTGPGIDPNALAAAFVKAVKDHGNFSIADNPVAYAFG